jgi:hypothetical protein
MLGVFQVFFFRLFRYFRLFRNLSSCLLPIILFLAALFKEEVNQLSRRVVHFNHEFVHFAGEVFEQPYRRDRHGKSDRSGNERFRDNAGYRRDTGRSRITYSLERVDDSEQRAEQPHEQSG